MRGVLAFLLPLSPECVEGKFCEPRYPLSTPEQPKRYSI
jgi:hypothetical protein